MMIIKDQTTSRVVKLGEPIGPRAKGTPILPPVTHLYSYETPATGAAPAPGSIVHADNVINKLAVSHLDLNGVDVSASIGQITTGDRVSVGSTVYDVVAPTVADTGFSYITIEPEVQKQAGVYPVKAWR
jgi:hypothetical protein